jgi:hypothetical protein
MAEYQQNVFRKIVWPASVVLLTLVVAALIFKSYLLHPNQHIFAFGGDPFVIYYDMIYHANFDHGTMFGGMNYPYGEYIFLTDAQGAFATLLQWTNHNLFFIGDSIPGIVHSLTIYLLPVCSLMVFYILRYFDVRPWLALVFAVLITFLSPAMLRFGNHFGLAYPFVIPMAMLWMLRKYKYPRLEIRDALVVLILIFFTFNNPYSGFNATGFLLGTAAILIATGFYKTDRMKSGLLIGSGGLLAILVPFLVFHFNDPVHDRLQQQWGFFYFNATFPGLLFPPLSLFHEILTCLKISIQPGEPESYMNIGLVSMLLWVAILVFVITGVWRKIKLTGWTTFSTENLILLGGAAMMFLYAANHSILEISKSWMENHLGPLLMFKASARLGWSFYFAIAISGVLFLDQGLKKIKSPIFSYGIALVLMTTWAYEIKTYVSHHYSDTFHDNFLKTASKNEMLKILQDNHIDLSQFQAMLVLPKMMAWNDDFLSDINWAAQFFSMRISAATGLPLISAMLSRSSTGQTAEAIQMLADPVVHRDLIAKLPNHKDILLLVGGQHRPLSVGEQYLIDISSPLFLSNDFSLYRLKLDTLQQSQTIAEAQNLYRQHPPLSKDVVHLSFDNTASTFSFYGQGAKYVYRGQTILIDRSLPVEKDTQYVFSAWSRIETDKPGVGEWHLVIQDSLGQVIREMNTETRRSNDIQDLWIRSEVTFDAPKGCRIQATVLTDKNIYIDEVLMYPVHAATIVDLPGSKEFLFNGYKVQKPKE